MKEAALSLNEREQRILGRIAEELARSAPTLVTLVHGFNRLASGEAMPVAAALVLSHIGHGAGGAGSCQASSFAVCTPQAANAP